MRLIAIIVLFGAIANWSSVVLKLLNLLIVLLLIPKDLDHFFAIEDLGSLLSTLGVVGCTAGYLLANESKNWTWLGRLTLVASLLFLVQGILKSFGLVSVSEGSRVYYDVMMGMTVLVILLYFISTFLTKKVGFKFSYSLWGTISFVLELGFVVTLNFSPIGIAVFVLASHVVTGVFSTVCLRYSVRLFSSSIRSA